jgi:hypothetical protein
VKGDLFGSTIFPLINPERPFDDAFPDYDTDLDLAYANE